MILIVEDELIIANNIAMVLNKLGYEKVKIATTVTKALAIIEEEKPDLVLTDIMLGQKETGIDLAEVLSKVLDIPFIYITSHSSLEVVNKAKLTKPKAYIVKPFKREDIEVAVNLALFSDEVQVKVPTFLIKQGRTEIEVPLNNIVWIEADGNQVVFNLINKTKYSSRITLAEVKDQLPLDVFKQIHKSFIINLNCIISKKGQEVLLINNTTLPIGRHFIAVLK